MEIVSIPTSDKNAKTKYATLSRNTDVENEEESMEHYDNLLDLPTSKGRIKSKIKIN